MASQQAGRNFEIRSIIRLTRARPLKTGFPKGSKLRVTRQKSKLFLKIKHNSLYLMPFPGNSELNPVKSYEFLKFWPFSGVKIPYKTRNPVTWRQIELERRTKNQSTRLSELSNFVSYAKSIRRSYGHEKGEKPVFCPDRISCPSKTSRKRASYDAK